MKKLPSYIFTLVLFATSLAFAGAAPPLTRVAVEKVWSANRPAGETILTGQYSTVKNHGGEWIRVQVREYGYGTRRFAKFNNRTMNEVSLQRINDSYGNIIGWRIIYEFIPVKGWFAKGTFTYQADSLNYSPYYPRTQNTFINVR